MSETDAKRALKTAGVKTTDSRKTCSNAGEFYLHGICGTDSYCAFIFPVSQSGTVLHTAREKEKPYTSDQEDPDVVQPYAAYSPPGQPRVKKKKNQIKMLHNLKQGLTLPHKQTY